MESITVRLADFSISVLKASAGSVYSRYKKETLSLINSGCYNNRRLYGQAGRCLYLQYYIKFWVYISRIKTVGGAPLYALLQGGL